MQSISEGKEICEYSSSHDEYQSSSIKWNQYEYHEYNKDKTTGSFYRINIENIDSDLWYIDIGFTLN